MRLVNVRTYEVKEFFGGAIPPYAILAHTWGKEEVTLPDMQNLELAESKHGFNKIRLTCEEATRRNIDWAWIDTCCVDKTSLTDLSESINSMYMWYEDSQVCFAYLEDVEASPGGKKWSDLLRTDMQKSRWFTRGWTLQELVAPCEVIFFNHGWEDLGGRNSMPSELSTITGIPRDILSGAARPWEYAVGARMSWAARRKCSRVEDVGYCLMGLFGINMPLLYGEGSNAFVRLQQEILRDTNDLSLLAWTVTDPRHDWLPTGILAKSPMNFERSGVLERSIPDIVTASAMTKLGLQIERPLLPAPKNHAMSQKLRFMEYFPAQKAGIYTIHLLYHPHTKESRRSEKFAGVAINVVRIPDEPSNLQFYRLGRLEMDLIQHQSSPAPGLETNFTPETVYICKKMSRGEELAFADGGIHLHSTVLPEYPSWQVSSVNKRYPASRFLPPFMGFQTTMNKPWDSIALQANSVNRPAEESDMVISLNLGYLDFRIHLQFKPPNSLSLRLYERKGWEFRDEKEPHDCNNTSCKDTTSSTAHGILARDSLPWAGGKECFEVALLRENATVPRFVLVFHERHSTGLSLESAVREWLPDFAPLGGVRAGHEQYKSGRRTLRSARGVLNKYVSKRGFIGRILQKCP